MGRLIRAQDWAATPLGPMEAWPQSLRVAVRLCLSTRHPMFIWWGPELIQFYNDAYAVSLGPEKHPSALGGRGRDTWPEIWAVIGPQIDQVMAGGEPTWHEDQLVPIVRHGGLDEVYWTYSYSPIDDEAAPNGVGGVLVICRETTAEVRERRETNTRYRALFEAVEAGFALVEVDHKAPSGLVDMRVVEANPAYFRQTGLGPDILGRWLREALPTLEEHWYETYGRVARTGEPERFEQGSSLLGRWFDAYAFRLGEGGQARVAILFSDISERRQAEEALRASEEFGRRVLQSSADCIKVLSFDARLEFMSEGGMCVMEVEDFSAIEGSSWPDLWEGDGRAKALDALDAARRGAEGRFEGPAPTLKGSLRRWDVAVTPITGADGAPEKILVVSRDITRQRETETQLRELNATLERRVEERTGELMAVGEALRQSQKMDAMGQLTGGVAHDFNNLLTPIVAVLDRLQRQGAGGEREQRLIAGAAQSAERARTLVQRLLAFARRQPLRPVAVDVAELVRGMADLVASTTGPQIRVAVEVAGDLPAAKGDPNQLEMALLNLAVNARDAMPEGGTLRISATAEAVGAPANRTLAPDHAPQLAPGHYVRLSVADTGIGMDEATLARAVEPFFSTKGVGQGTGLGLSMVHGLASQLGGTLAITSRSGLGTNVELWLPQSDLGPEAPAPMPVTAPNRLRGTVLLVDDEEAVRLSTADMLGELGYHVLEVASAEEALAALRNGANVDLVVTDHLMPGMSGTDLARTVRARHPDLPVLVVSGYAESEGIEPDLPRLAKPFRRDELAASLAGLGGLGG